MLGYLPTSLSKMRLWMCSTFIWSLLSPSRYKDVGVLPRAGGFTVLEPCPGKSYCKERCTQGFRGGHSLSAFCLLDKGCSWVGSHWDLTAKPPAGVSTCVILHISLKKPTTKPEQSNSLVLQGTSHALAHEWPRPKELQVALTAKTRKALLTTLHRWKTEAQRE